MKPGTVAVVGAAETNDLGVMPELSRIQLHWTLPSILKGAGLKPSVSMASRPPARRPPPLPRRHRGRRLFVHVTRPVTGGITRTVRDRSALTIAGSTSWHRLAFKPLDSPRSCTLGICASHLVRRQVTDRSGRVD
jgi:hypothetical protein